MKPLLALILLLAGAGVAQAQTLQFSPQVTLKIGQSAILNGARANQCGAPAPDWATVRTWLPPTDLGTFADAGLQKKFSDSCRGEVAVRAVRFTARKTGSERMRLFGDQLTVSVQ
ncbi:MAG: hypothetical protein ACRCXM_01280 [Beijerinckiaceae bacterium]